MLRVGAPWEASWSHLGKKYPKRTPNIKITRPLWEVMLEKICSRIAFWSKFVVSIFTHIFQVVFGKPLTRFFKDFEVVLMSIYNPFCIFFCRCCKSAKLQPLSRETHAFEGATLSVFHDFRHAVHLFFKGAVRMRFLCDFHKC